jgi:iron(III) transport system ATP-binding protein
MIDVENLIKQFVGDHGTLRALRGVTFSVPEGQIFTLLGPSGCGKTTTLRSIAGLERPEEGEIRIGSTTVFSSRQRVALAPERRPIGMVFQSYAIWPHMTVFDNVAYPLRAQRLSDTVIAKRVQDCLELVGLPDLGNRPAPLLSGGQQQRVALARALVSEPSVLLLDEPLSNLDAKLREQMRLEIRALQKRIGITAVYVTHDQEEALVISDQIAVMRAGRLLEVANSRAIYHRPRHRFTAEFLGLANVVRGEVLDGGPAGGSVPVQTPLGPLVAETHRAVERGDWVTLFFRPEDVRFGGGGDDCAADLRARVEQVTFLGRMVDCRLKVGDQPIRVLAPGSLEPTEGDVVGLQVMPGRCRVVEDDED